MSNLRRKIDGYPAPLWLKVALVVTTAVATVLGWKLVHVLLQPGP